MSLDYAAERTRRCLRLMLAGTTLAFPCLGQPLPSAAAGTNVRIDALVTQEGRIVTGLEQGDFLVRDEGEPRSTVAFASAVPPLDVVLLCQFVPVPPDGKYRPNLSEVRIPFFIANGHKPRRSAGLPRFLAIEHEQRRPGPAGVAPGGSCGRHQLRPGSPDRAAPHLGSRGDRRRAAANRDAQRPYCIRGGSPGDRMGPPAPGPGADEGRGFPDERHRAGAALAETGNSGKFGRDRLRCAAQGSQKIRGLDRECERLWFSREVQRRASHLPAVGGKHGPQRR